MAVAYVRGRVPEFEPAYAELLSDEGYWELGGLQVFSELARWVLEHADDTVAARTFAAVEFVMVERSVRVGQDEAVEFFETLAAEAERRPARFRSLRDFWGPAMRAWMADYGPGDVGR